MSRHNREKNNKPLEKLYVARTADPRQEKYVNFLNDTARGLGRLASINTVSGTHITLLESAGTRPSFRRRNYMARDVSRFSGDMQSYLDEVSSTEPIRLTVDPKRPLRFIGSRTQKLALNIIEDARLGQERENIENFLLLRFGEVPPLRDFEPHIVIGSINGRIEAAERRNPGLLLKRAEPVIGERPVIPESVSLNGLMVYLGRIED